MKMWLDKGQVKALEGIGLVTRAQLGFVGFNELISFLPVGEGESWCIGFHENQPYFSYSNAGGAESDIYGTELIDCIFDFIIQTHKK